MQVVVHFKSIFVYRMLSWHLSLCCKSMKRKFDTIGLFLLLSFILFYLFIFSFKFNRWLPKIWRKIMAENDEEWWMSRSVTREKTTMISQNIWEHFRYWGPKDITMRKLDLSYKKRVNEKATMWCEFKTWFFAFLKTQFL